MFNPIPSQICKRSLHESVKSEDLSAARLWLACWWDWGPAGLSDDKVAHVQLGELREQPGSVHDDIMNHLLLRGEEGGVEALKSNMSVFLSHTSITNRHLLHFSRVGGHA